MERYINKSFIRAFPGWLNKTHKVYCFHLQLTALCPGDRTFSFYCPPVSHCCQSRLWEPVQWATFTSCCCEKKCAPWLPRPRELSCLMEPVQGEFPHMPCCHWAFGYSVFETLFPDRGERWMICKVGGDCVEFSATWCFLSSSFVRTWTYFLMPRYRII